jgi:plasmid stabilization system protein ParE
MKNVKFHPDAEKEFLEAALYYEHQQVALGRRFVVSVQDAINRITADPDLYPIAYLKNRRCLVKTFPFGIIFHKQKDAVVIVAVMHLHRDPDYWKKRR